MADADVLVIEAEPDDVELVVGSPTSTEPSFTVEDVQGLKGDKGDQGDQGPEGIVPDPGDLTVYFENGLA